nr:MAG TPA: hypothetical protein [Caudoviricetes sp.]
MSLRPALAATAATLTRMTYTGRPWTLSPGTRAS